MEMESNQSQLQSSGKSRFAEFFGQFADPNFYLELAKMAIKEVIKAAALALTGTITYYIQKRFSGNSITQQAPIQDNTLTHKAFGNSDSYRDQYKSSYYPTTATQPATTFPGFGSR